MGLLRINATINLQQFWPVGNSDADTASIIVNTDGVEFQREPGEPFQVTRVFDRAVAVSGNQRERVMNDTRRMKIRFQGVDTPELHFTPRKPDGLFLTPAQYTEFLNWNHDYRQNLAETATLALEAELSLETGNVKPCVVTTQVGHPNEVFDMFGRGIGDLTVRVGSADVQVNRWLLSEGWALPSFYASMTGEEIMELTALSAEARERGAGLWPHVGPAVADFDPDKRFRGAGVPINATADAGPTMNPKIFRRQATWFALFKAGAAPADFIEYLILSGESFRLVSEFLAPGGNALMPHPIAEMFTAEGDFVYQPEEIVYFETESTLLDENGDPVTDW